MPVCYIACQDAQVQQIHELPAFADEEIMEVEFPITGSDFSIDYLIVGPAIRNLTRLCASISDWNIPPATLLILSEDRYEERSHYLHHHPRVGRCIFFCRDTQEDIERGLNAIHHFHQTRSSLEIDHSISGNYTTNNISPRWLFQTMMEHLDEYIYFKDADSRFLAVSRYLTESSGKETPSEVLGLTDFELFDQTHSEEAFADERRIASGEINELDKEECVLRNNETMWVASRKLPLRTRSGFLAGSFGLSRDITEAKTLNLKLEENHQRMQSELLLARNLQSTLMHQSVPEFRTAEGNTSLEIATKYIPSFHLSGDFYSVTQTNSGKAAILIADVMGHGVRAAMVTAMIQIAVQQLHDYADQPAVFMSKLNDMMHRTIKPIGQTIFATAAYCTIDIENRTLSYAHAGARHGVYVPAADDQSANSFTQCPINPALGLIPCINFLDTSMPLQSGDEVILYTDGIIESAMDDEEYSETRLIEFLMEHRRDKLPEMLDALLNSVQSFTGNETLDDDVCLIGLRLP